MTDGAALLAAILAKPDCDTVRLVYADYLQEQGEEARAEFIRVQVEYTRLDSHNHGPNARHSGSCDVCDRRAVMATRERELLHAEHHWQEWAGPAINVVPGAALYYDHLEFTRGFVESLTCTAVDFLQHEAAILAAHPVRKLSVTGIPFIAPGDQGWTFLNDPTPTPFTESEIRAEIAREAAPRQPNGEWLRAMCRLRWPGIGIEFELPPARPGVERFDDINEVLRRIATTSTVPAE